MKTEDVYCAAFPLQHTLAAYLALNVFATTCRMSVTASMPFHSLPAGTTTQQVGVRAKEIVHLAAAQSACAGQLMRC